MIRVGVVGCGYWGPNLIRNFAESGRTELRVVCDLQAERLAKLRARYPAVRMVTDFEAVASDPELDAVALATPVGTHHPLALRLLRAGKHVLVEKPLAVTAQQVQELIAAAERADRVLMVDHTFVFTGAVRKIKELVSSGALGDIYYYDSVRVNLGLFQHGVNVLWDLAVHDLSIMDHVLGMQPQAVSATGVSHVPGEPENIGYLTVFFDGGLLAHVHVNWLSPVKVRRTLIGGSRKMILFDDLEPSEKVKVYDRGITVDRDREQIYNLLISYRMGDMWAPQLDTTEALRSVVAHFADCIERGSRPVTDGAAGLRVVRILEAAAASMRGRGQPVELPAA